MALPQDQEELQKSWISNVVVVFVLLMALTASMAVFLRLIFNYV